MVEPESDPGFTFVDRRRRADDEQSRRAAQRPLTPDPPPSQSPSAPTVPAGGRPAGATGGSPRADFPSLCVMLYSDALVNLGQVADPATGQPLRDLEQARFAIDLLAMLREKTEGNRTAEESSVLEEVLSTLQMAFVRASRGR